MDKSPQKIKEMFNSIAGVYDLNNNLISFGQHKRIKEKSIKYLKPADSALDLCTGTGDIANYLSEITCNVTGLDFSDNMLEIAKKRFKNIDFIEADCTELPFEDNSFDIVTISFGLRNIENYNKALDEIYRVLKPNGQFLHLDFGKKNILVDIVFNNIIPILIKIIYKNNLPYDYLIESKQQFFDEKYLIQLFKEHGLKLKEKHSFLFGGISCQICNKI